MMKRMTRGLAFMLMASPLVIVACGDKSSSKDDAGPVTNLDGAVGADTSRTDVLANTDLAPVPADGGTVSDARQASDAVVDAPAVTDAISVDAPQGADLLAGETAAAGDATPAGDAKPATDATSDSAPAVCTETTKFSGGSVTADRTLSKACSPYTIKTDIDVNGNATLTIEPGVTLRFDPKKSIKVGRLSAAKLMAVGTKAEPVVFTSSAATPGAGDWAGVQMWTNPMAGNTLKHARLEYCGSDRDACLLGTGVKANRVTVDNVTFSNVGPGADAILEKDKDSNFTITNCTFKDIPSTPTQQYAISVYAESVTGIDTDNTFNGAMVQLMGGTVSVNSAWKYIGTTVAVTGEVRVEGASNPVLTIAAGSSYRFASRTGLVIGYSDPGSLALAGTATAPIELTSLAGSRGAGDWVGITLWYSATATIKYATISYAGSGKGAIDVVSDSDTLDIQNSQIVSSATYGIRVPCKSKADITNTGNTFTACASGEVGPGPTCH